MATIGRVAALPLLLRTTSTSMPLGCTRRTARMIVTSVSLSAVYRSRNAKLGKN